MVEIARGVGDATQLGLPRATPVFARDPVPLIRGAGEHQPESVLELLSRGKLIGRVATPATELSSRNKRFLGQMMRNSDTTSLLSVRRSRDTVGTCRSPHSTTSSPR